jgi:hypothetical protein
MVPEQLGQKLDAIIKKRWDILNYSARSFAASIKFFFCLSLGFAGWRQTSVVQNTGRR